MIVVTRQELESTIGGTPMVELRVRMGSLTHRILLKLEGRNGGGGSIKARTARNLYDTATADGLLAWGSTVVESSSGNLAKALVVQGRARGLEVIVVVDPLITHANLEAIRAEGGVIEQVDCADANGSYLSARLARVQKIIESRPGTFWTNQYASPANPSAHFYSTGPEIVQGAPDASAIFVPCSTGGTACGIHRRVVAEGMPALVIPVDVPGSHALVPAVGQRLLPGVGASQQSVFIVEDVRRRAMIVDDALGIAACRLLRERTGISVGGSSGVAFVAALQWLGERLRETTVVTVAADSGENYAFGDNALEHLGIVLPSVSHLFDDLFLPHENGTAPLFAMPTPSWI